ncbi:MAG: right-handed parallel beta-helix repeat-containing protein [Candidatus Thorarchaeota archaeon]
MERRVLGGLVVVLLVFVSIAGILYLRGDQIIEISSNSDFEEIGFRGDGSLESPYIIENLRISISEPLQSCIFIRYTSAYFIIQNCELNSHSGGIGIVIRDSSNFAVIGCSVTGGLYGISTMDCDFFSVENNTISDCGTALSFVRTTNYLEEGNGPLTTLRRAIG